MHGCLSLMSVECRIGSGVCDEMITRSEESHRVFVCVRARACVCLMVCDLGIPAMTKKDEQIAS